MIATHTPEKEALLQTKIPRDVKKTKLFLEKATPSTNKEPILSDHSSDDVPEEESVIIDLHAFKVLEHEPKLGDFVLVEFNTAPKKYYIGILILAKYPTEDFDISYLYISSSN